MYNNIIMKISTNIGPISSFVGEEKAIELVAKAGFDYFDFSLFNMVSTDWKTMDIIYKGHPLEKEETARELAIKVKEIGFKYGITCNQSHAPFPTNFPPIREKINLALECSAMAGSKICVVHPDNNLSAEENAKLYQMFLPTAKKLGIKIATENMWNWPRCSDHATEAACSTSESFIAHLKAVDDDAFVACVDIGHAEMFNDEIVTAPKMIRALGPYVQALHVHDNDKRFDSHQLPGTMKIDFDAVIDALVDINYQGDLTLECDNYVYQSTKNNLEDRIKQMAIVARQLADLFEKKMKEKCTRK